MKIYLQQPSGFKSTIQLSAPSISKFFKFKKSEKFDLNNNKNAFDWLGGANGSVFTSELINLRELNGGECNITHLQDGFYRNLKYVCLDHTIPKILSCFKSLAIFY